MPQFRIHLRAVMLAVAVIAAVLGLLAYRNRLLSSDETLGGFDGLVVFTVDLGFIGIIWIVLGLIVGLLFLTLFLFLDWTSSRS